MAIIDSSGILHTKLRDLLFCNNACAKREKLDRKEFPQKDNCTTFIGPSPTTLQVSECASHWPRSNASHKTCFCIRLTFIIIVNFIFSIKYYYWFGCAIFLAFNVALRARTYIILLFLFSPSLTNSKCLLWAIYVLHNVHYVNIITFYWLSRSH